MNTPTLAHVALVEAHFSAVFHYATDSDDGSAYARVETVRQAIYDALAQPALAAPVPSEDGTDFVDEWRRLALQFDGHRMQALGHLKSILHDPEIDRTAAIAFVSGPPLSGEEVLAQRIAALAAQQPTPAASPDSDSLREAVLTAWAQYEKMGEVCPFEGQPMIYASTLEDLFAIASQSAQVMQPVEASPAHALTKKFHMAIRLADDVGRSRGSNSYAINKRAVSRLVDIEIEIEGDIKAAFAPTVEVAAPVAPTSAAEIMLEHGMKDVPTGCKQVWFTRKEVEQITKAALSAAQPGPTLIPLEIDMMIDDLPTLYGVTGNIANSNMVYLSRYRLREILSAAKPELSDAQIETCAVYVPAEHGVRIDVVATGRAILKLQAGGEA